jgi:putative ABC transport system substrate-binding protein
MVPGIATVGFLVNPSNPNSGDEARDIQDAGHSLGLQIFVFKVSNDGDLDKAFASFAQQGVGAFLVATDASFTSRFGQIMALAARHALPGIANSRDYVDSGGLMSYGANQVDAFRLVGNYAGRILKGERPANLPVQQPTVFELVINLKTAKALGITVPQTLLVAATEVIE